MGVEFLDGVHENLNNHRVRVEWEKPKGIGVGVGEGRLESLVSGLNCHQLTVCPWTSLSPSLGFSFIFWKMHVCLLISGHFQLQVPGFGRGPREGVL